MTLFKLDRGEVCTNDFSERPDWDQSAFFINIDRITYLDELSGGPKPLSFKR